MKQMPLGCCVVLLGAVHFGCASSETTGDSADGSALGSPSHPCANASDCMGGACINGSCCEAKQACGSTCCGSATVCVFDSCVTPGKPCRSNKDCSPGEYCEPALGGSDAGTPEAGCDPLPNDGRCLPLPPICSPDGGSMLPDGGSCVTECQ